MLCCIYVCVLYAYKIMCVSECECMLCVLEQFYFICLKTNSFCPATLMVFEGPFFVVVLTMEGGNGFQGFGINAVCAG